VHQAIQAGLIDLQHIEGRKLTADAQTKAIPNTLFDEHTKNAQNNEDTLRNEPQLLLMSSFDMTEFDMSEFDSLFASPVTTPPDSNRTPILSSRDLGLRSTEHSPVQTPRSILNLNASSRNPQLTEADRVAANTIARNAANNGNQLLLQGQARGLNPAEQQTFTQLLALNTSTQLVPPIAVASLVPIHRTPSYAPRVNTTTTTMTTTATHRARRHTRRIEQDSNADAVLMMQSAIEANRPHPNDQLRDILLDHPNIIHVPPNKNRTLKRNTTPTTTTNYFQVDQDRQSRSEHPCNEELNMAKASVSGKTYLYTSSSC
jgi:hypothetical protein